MTLYPIKDRDLWDQITKDIGGGVGCYILRCLGDTANTFSKINRVLGEDETGILYIGSGASEKSGLRGRITQLRKAICAAAGKDNFTDKTAHVCGHKYNKQFQKVFPFDNLRVEIFSTNSQEEAWEKEVELLNEYESKFGETPPFNEGRPKAKHLTA